MTRFPLPGPAPSASAHWRSAAFLAEVRAFVEPELGPVELELSKVRGWSVVLTARGAEGLHWVKQNCPSQSFEAALLAELGALVPERVVPLRALDRDRGLLLMPDQGAVHETMTADVALWCDVVRQWALLQREVLAHADRLGAAGVKRLAPEDCPQLLSERAGLLHALPADDPLRLDDDGLARATAAHDLVAESVEVVGALGLPLALNHNDLHGGNVFASSPSGGGEVMRFFDLGDALLTDPMAVLFTPLGVLRETLGCASDDPRLWRVAESWAEVWSDLAPATDLRRALPHAMRLARMPRHEGWLRVMPSLSAEERAEWGDGPAAHLARSGEVPLLGTDPGADAGRP